MELVLVTREYRGDRDRWSLELSHWRDRYPRHAAENALLPDLLHQVGQFAAQANQVAILLPLSDRTEPSATAIRDGILAAHYYSSPPKPQLRFYDTGGNARLTWSVYQQAIEEGADFVIGPLLKDSINNWRSPAFCRSRCWRSIISPISTTPMNYRSTSLACHPRTKPARQPSAHSPMAISN